MLTLLGLVVAYLVIGILLAWGVTEAGGQSFKLNKEAMPFILTWPALVWSLLFRT